VLLAVLAASELSVGLEMYRQRRFPAAEREFARVLMKDPQNWSARLYLARTMIELNRVPEALVEIERVLAGPAAVPELRFQAGRILRELAERRFDQLQSVAPDSAPLRELAGARYERSGDLAEALKQYRAAAELDPKRLGVHYRIGNVLWRMRELDPALAELQKELSANPHHGMANLRLGQLLLARDQDEEALPHLQRAIAAMPESVEARREAGKAYKKAGRIVEARREWEAVAKARPEDDQVHYLLGNLYREIGEAGLAKRELEVHREILERRRESAEKR
jgi:protein O-GlcNAc transferase